MATDSMANATRKESQNGFLVSNTTAGAVIGLIIFLGVVILYQQYQVGLASDMIGILGEHAMKK